MVNVIGFINEEEGFNFETERKKKKRKILFLVFSLLCMIFAGAKEVSAKADYKPLFSNYENNAVVKSGNYYFKYSGGHIYMSKSKNGTFAKTPLRYGAYSNGSQACYMDSTSRVLHLYTFKTKKTKKSRILSAKNDMYAHISAVHGKNIYLTCEFEEAFPYGTYVYNISKKKVIKKIKDCKITDIGGDYLVSSTNAFGSELILYRFTPEGLEKVKKLCNFGISRGFSKNKLYYVNYPVKSQYGDFYEDKRAEIYCCNKDGTGEKKLAVLENAEGKMVQKITSSYCTYWDNRVTYKYTYKTKKIKKISGR